MRFLGRNNWRNRPAERQPEEQVINNLSSEETGFRKEVVRMYLLENGWKKDGRCTRHETYKKKIAGVVYQVKFRGASASFDRGVLERTYQGMRTVWKNMNTEPYEYFDDFSQMIIFLNRLPHDIEPKYQPNADDKDNEIYLSRMGII